jgi:formylglycine-generating enzyme required for sulfatase activity
MSDHSLPACAHAVTVSGLGMDECAINNAAFAAFVAATGWC